MPTGIANIELKGKSLTGSYFYAKKGDRHEEYRI